MFFLFFAIIVDQTIGFGSALILLPLITFLVDLQSAMVLMALWGFVSDSFKLVNYWKFKNWNYIKKVAFGGIPGIIIGTYLVVIAPTDLILLFLGIFIFIFSSIKIKRLHFSRNKININKELNSIKIDADISAANNDKKGEIKANKNFRQDLLYKEINSTLIIFGGFNYGFFSGLIGCAGPINVVILEATSHSKESFIADFAAPSIPLSLIKILIMINSGFSEYDYFPPFFLGIFVIFICSKIAKKVTLKIPKRQFELAVFFLLYIICFKLIFSAIYSLFF